MQLDIGFGDVVQPAADERDYPTILAFPAPRLRMYPRETLVAEKFEAMVFLETLNNRAKRTTPCGRRSPRLAARKAPIVATPSSRVPTAKSPLPSGQVNTSLPSTILAVLRRYCGERLHCSTGPRQSPANNSGSQPASAFYTHSRGPQKQSREVTWRA